MSRFTDPNKWHKDKWFRKLEPLQKLIFLYLIDNCDIAGFWEKDFDMMAYSIGVSEEELLGAYKGLEKGVIECNGWVWIRKFIKHQKNLPLNPKNNAHKGIIRILELQEKRFIGSQEFNEFLIEHGVKEEKEPEKEGASEGLNSPTGKGISKGKGFNKEEDIENLSDSEGIEIPSLEEFKKYGNQIGMIPDYCEHIYESSLSRGWRNGHDNLIRDWMAYLRMKFKYQDSWMNEQGSLDESELYDNHPLRNLS